MIVYKVILIVLSCTLWSTVKSSRILGVFPMGAPSHYILGNALMKGLAEAGHNVTMISPFEEKDPIKGGSYKDVVLTGFLDDHKKMLKLINFLDNKNQSMIALIQNFVVMLETLNDKFFANENVQKLLKSDETFDVLIVEQFLVDSMKILGNIYNVPVISLSTMGATPWVNKIVGNPSPNSYIPNMETDYTPHMTFTQRLGNLFFSLIQHAVDEFFYFPGQNRILKKHFTNPPDIYDLNRNVSLILLNSHESLNQAVPLVPNLIEIGGFHVRPPKALPKDLQEYLDNAKEGVVYFSLGSNLRSKNLPAEKRDAILKAFSKLKEKVLWKWEDDDLPGKPANVKLGKWLPQQDILAHPNVKLFITHSGLLSTTETVYHGVPILAIPVFGDQHNNAKLAVSSGYALSLPYEDPSFSEEKLSELLQELLTNPKYSENVKRRSRLFHDRPMKPLDTAVYWVEYIIRNGGAPHLRVAGADLPWYKYHSLDVISFLLAVASLFTYLFYVSVRKLLSWCGICSNKKTKSKKD